MMLNCSYHKWFVYICPHEKNNDMDSERHYWSFFYRTPFAADEIHRADDEDAQGPV